MEKSQQAKQRLDSLLRQISPNVHKMKSVLSETKEKPKPKSKLIGFPNVEAKATLFSRIMEKVYTKTEKVIPDGNLVEMPKGDPPELDKIFVGKIKGHICVCGLKIKELKSRANW
jgi:hypothetical protein